MEKGPLDNTATIFAKDKSGWMAIKSSISVCMLNHHALDFNSFISDKPLWSKKGCSGPLSSPSMCNGSAISSINHPRGGYEEILFYAVLYLTWYAEITGSAVHTIRQYLWWNQGSVQVYWLAEKYPKIQSTAHPFPLFESFEPPPCSHCSVSQGLGVFFRNLLLHYNV